MGWSYGKIFGKYPPISVGLADQHDYWCGKRLPHVSSSVEIRHAGREIQVIIGNVVLTEPDHEFPSDALLLQVMLIAG